MKNILTLSLLSLLGMGLSLQAQSTSFLAGTDFAADLPEYQVGFTLTDGSGLVNAAGTDAIGNSFSLFFDNPVDMSALASNDATIEFTAGAGHAANSSFSISLFDSGFASSYDLSGFSFSDTLAVSTTLDRSGSINLADVQGLTVNTGGLTGSVVNVDVTSFTIVPEPSTYALIAGFAAFLFVAIRRRK